MKLNFSALALAACLGLASFSVAACSSDDGTDAVTGKAISDIDIGGDITIDKGETKQLSATVKYADGTTKDVTTDTAELVWNVGDTGVATISSTGLVTGVGIGTTKIHATYQGHAGGDHALIVH